YILMIGDSPDVLATYTTGNAGGGADLLYVQMDADLYPDMMISRWPIDDSTELINMRDKILHYEHPTAANSAWLNRALFLAGDDYIPNGVTTHEDVRAELLDPPPNSAETEQWWGDTENPTTADLIADLNTGRAWAVYSAHSGPSGWSGDPPLSSGDMPNFGNTYMYPIAHGHSCSSNEWENYDDVFGEAAVIQPSKGFVSYWGGSNSTYWDGDDWLEKGFFDSLVEADMADNTGAWDGHFSNVAACYAGLTEVSLRGGGGAGETYYWEIYNLNGDPTLDPFTRQPTAINVGAPAALGPIAIDNFTVTVVDASAGAVPGALVAASQDGTLLGAGYTDGTGTAIFHIDAPAAGTPVLVRVTGHNLLPTDESVMVGADADGVVTLNAMLYPCSAVAVIDVFDANASGPFSVNLQTSGANSIAVSMTDAGDITGHFQGSADLGVDLIVADGDTLSAIYDDLDNGTGSPETKTVTAAIDCAGPVISNVQLTVGEGSMTVTFDTDEPSTTVVKYGTTTPPGTVISSDALVTSHVVEIEGLDPCTVYFVQLASDDALGNHTVDNNGGAFYSAETSGWQAFFSEDFSGDPGWAIDNGGNGNGWAFGVPQGGGGQYGGPDPTAGFTGDNVYGVNLAGDYDNSLSTDQLKLTTPAIDCGAATSVFLSFRRWLGVESPTFDHARVQVSVDGGSSWPTVWENTSSIEESAWSEQTIDLTSVAAGQPDVRIRWTQGETDSSWQYCGWNIDDVVVEGAAPCGQSSTLFLDGFETGDCSNWSFEVP
ncbi:MAG: C25 family cysteine peptidase, partial [Acidobacteriota bacterium]